MKFDLAVPFPIMLSLIECHIPKIDVPSTWSSRTYGNFKALEKEANDSQKLHKF